MADIEQRARELLAAEFEKEGLTETARLIRSGMMNKHRPVDSYILRAIVAALASQSQVPDGYVLVPREPTDAMLVAAHAADTTRAPNLNRWRAMIAAAPAPEVSVGAYPVPRSRKECAALARIILAHLSVIDAHIDAAIARAEHEE